MARDLGHLPIPWLIKPDYPEGDPCEWCWGFVSPGFFFNFKRRKIETERGTLHFCDEHCRIDYQIHGRGLYELGFAHGSGRSEE